MTFSCTSIGDAAAIDHVANIISASLDRAPIVVVPAMAGVTDALLCAAQTALKRRLADATSIIDELLHRHITTARTLLSESDYAASEPDAFAWVDSRIRALVQELRGLVDSVYTLQELTPRSQDAIVSFGEQLASILVLAALRKRIVEANLLDARSLITTDSNFTKASPDFSATNARIRDVLLPIANARCVVVTQGNLGSTEREITTTLGPGGSDFSAAIIAAAISADAIEIWTDVDGLMTADRQVVPEARRLRVISFAEAAELLYFGTQVLHPSALQPAVERDIPVYVYNTFNAAREGTLIRSTSTPEPLIKSIALKRGITVVNISSARMLLACGFLHAIFEVFDEYQTSVDVITTSEVSVSMTLDNTECIAAIEMELRRRNAGEITIEPDQAIVCIVGENLRNTPGLIARIFRVLDDWEIHMISLGASELNLTLVVVNDDAEEVVRSLHRELFAKTD